jgi:hypothetical protein
MRFQTAVGFLAVSFVLRGSAIAQSQALTNQDVLDMEKAGFSASLIEIKIANSPCQFDTAISALTALKSAGVDDAVIGSMIRCAPRKPSHEKPYVWVGANQEWIARNNSAAYATASSSSAVVTSSEKATVQTHSEYSDVTRQLSVDKCPAITITNNPADADYALTIERYNAGHLLTQKNSFSIFRSSDGKLLSSNTTTWLKNAAADISKAITNDSATKWPSNPSPSVLPPVSSPDPKQTTPQVKGLPQS